MRATPARRSTPIGRPRCSLCGSQVGSEWKVYEDGRAVCSRHRRTARCSWCGFPASFALDDYQYCHECQARTVTTSGQIAALGKLIKASLEPRSCWLAERVTLYIHSKESLASAGRDAPDALGMTEAAFRNDRLSHQKIWVRYGLPEEVCLMTLAHEYAHALLNYHGLYPLNDTQREGFCEYLAGVVVREQLPHSKPAARRYSRELARHDVYGQGMRLVTAVVRSHGEAAVIRAFLTGKTSSILSGL